MKLAPSFPAHVSATSSFSVCSGELYGEYDARLVEKYMGENEVRRNVCEAALFLVHDDFVHSKLDVSKELREPRW